MAYVVALVAGAGAALPIPVTASGANGSFAGEYVDEERVDANGNGHVLTEHLSGFLSGTNPPTGTLSFTAEGTLTISHTEYKSLKGTSSAKITETEHL